MRDTLDPSDASELVQLNGVLTPDQLRSRGFLFLPTSSHEAIEIDLAESHRDADTLIEEYWRFHPRYVFLKSVVRHARVADLGAGTGGLINWKLWGSPHRVDIAMYAIDAIRGELFDEYVDFDIVDLDRGQAKYPDGAFDAAICSHLIDFVPDRERLVREIVRLCRPGAKIYVEWPNSEPSRAIGRKAFATCGVVAETVHFSDDPSQAPPLSDTQMQALFASVGCVSLAGGIVANDYLYPELLRYGVMERDSDLTTSALWLALGAIRYRVFEKRFL